MSEARSRRIDELLARALETEPRERDTFLADACGEDRGLLREIESLLRAHESMGDFLEMPAAETLHALKARSRAVLEPGARIGSYEIVRVVEEGGSGTVYEAQQARPRRRVALKVMRSYLGSEAALRRFQEEAEILARLQHPGIAHVYEAGVHESGSLRLPFFAMEYVVGARTILEYAEAQALDTRGRLDLIARACDAIHHGHEKGIIHRDIKPANVLVDPTGQPKIIDFGIARVTGLETSTGPELLGTIPYMSPEQCDPGSGAIGVRSDVYALGVMAFELLTGRRPHDLQSVSITEAVRRIREDEPAPLAARDRSLRGDVEAIVHKALAKNRERRYASAASMADDIRRHLTDRPVEAREPGFFYHLRKFARRQRLAFLALTAVVVVSIGAAIVSAVLALQSARQREAERFQAYLANIAAASAALRVNDVAEARQRLDRAARDLRNWEWHHLHGRVDMGERTLRWNGHKVISGTVSPDGVVLGATGSDRDRLYRVAVWDLESGRMLHELEFPQPRIDAIAFAPDHRLMALGTAAGSLQIRETLTGDLVTTVRAHEETINDIAFDPTGRVVATASRDSLAKLWSVADGSHVMTLRGHTDRVICLEFDRRGRRLVTGGREGAIRIWDLATGASLRTLAGHGASVEGVALSPDGTRIASVSRDLTVRLWDAASGECLAVGRSHRSNVRDVAFSPDGRSFAAASWDRTVRLWSASDGREIACFRGHESSVARVGFHPIGPRAVSFSTDGAIKVWNTAETEDVATFLAHRSTVLSVAFAPDGRHFASAAADKTIRIWDAESRREVRTLSRFDFPVLAIEYDAEGEKLFTLDQGGNLRAWMAASGTHLNRQALGAQSMAVFPDGKRIVLGRSNGLVIVWDAEAFRESAQWRAHDKYVSSVAAGPAGRVIASASASGKVRTWDAASGRRLAEAKAHDTWVHAMAYGPDGRLLATASDDGTLKLLEADSLRVVATLVGHTDRVRAVAFSPDGSRLVSGAYDATVRLWDTETGQQVVVLHGHRYPVFGVDFSPDGTRLASVDGSAEDVLSAVKLWEAPSLRR